MTMLLERAGRGRDRGWAGVRKTGSQCGGEARFSERPPAAADQIVACTPRASGSEPNLLSRCPVLDVLRGVAARSHRRETHHSRTGFRAGLPRALKQLKVEPVVDSTNVTAHARTAASSQLFRRLVLPCSTIRSLAYRHAGQ